MQSTQAADVDMALGFCRADVAVVFHVQNLCLMDTEEKPLQMTVWGSMNNPPVTFFIGMFTISHGFWRPGQVAKDFGRLQRGQGHRQPAAPGSLQRNRQV